MDILAFLSDMQLAANMPMSQMRKTALPGMREGALAFDGEGRRSSRSVASVSAGMEID